MKRWQLTLFVAETESEQIEKVRRHYNPLQYALIPAHITLCREDELLQMERITENIGALSQENLQLFPDVPTRFDNGKGVYLPMKNVADFEALRKVVLAEVIPNPRQQLPHLTLMHPRNSRCTDAIFQEICQAEFPSILSFDNICLIEQEEAQKWKIIREFPFAKL
jgi:2'-5' RNA ligase